MRLYGVIVMPEFRYNPKHKIEESRPLSCPGADIWIHDTIIRRAVEIKTNSSFLFEVEYPIDWHSGNYGPKSLVFHDVTGVDFKFGNVAGCPAILEMTEVAKSDSKYEITLGTNHGDCIIECRSIEISDGWISTSNSDLKFDLEFQKDE